MSSYLSKMPSLMSCNIGQNDLNLKGCHWCQHQVNTKLQMCIDCLDAPGDSTPAEGTFVYLSNFTECWSGTKNASTGGWGLKERCCTRTWGSLYRICFFYKLKAHTLSYSTSRTRHRSLCSCFWWFVGPIWSTLQIFCEAQRQQHKYFHSSSVTEHHNVKAIDKIKFCVHQYQHSPVLCTV